MNVKLKSLLSEIVFNGDLEHFREPLRKYMMKTFPREYDSKQLLMFGLTLENLIDVILNRILSFKISYNFNGRGEDAPPSGYFRIDTKEIVINGIDYYKATSSKGHSYASYVDSVVYHELVHAVNYTKKLYDKISYDVLEMGEKYYSDPEEIRAYSSQIKDFLVDYLGFSRRQAESMMNLFTSDKSDISKKWRKKYYNLGESRRINVIFIDNNEIKNNTSIK